MALSIKSQVTVDFVQKTVNKINEYFTNLYEYKIFWLEDLLNILVGLRPNIFYEVAITFYTK